MYTNEQIKIATDMYFVDFLPQQQICERLGYPTQATLSRWVRDDSRYGKDLESGIPHRSRMKYPFEVRAEAVRLALEEHLMYCEISDRLDLCGPPIVSRWVAIARKKGLEGLMTREEKKEIGQTAADSYYLPDDIEELKRQNAELRMENAILEETIKTIKKDPGVDHDSFSNREKTLMIDALRNRFPLNDLLRRFDLPKSSFYYHLAAAAAGDKYADLRDRVIEIFHEADDARGYRYVHVKLRQDDDPVGCIRKGSPSHHVRGGLGGHLRQEA